ncbi:MAG: hypothetical protein LBL19_04525 [Spirochaetaceae bacterium]|jgi:hypothetical protein|nr:hypothetical protein [Spirochaetaceae bacterium]
MVRIFFYIRFQTQLYRIKPEVISTLETTVCRAIKTSGGEVVLEHQRISAVFEENTPGFWLDILTVLESALIALEKAAPDLYGYTVAAAHDVSEYEAFRLVLSVPVDSTGTGFWCSPRLQEALKLYLLFGEPLTKNDCPLNGYAQIDRIRTFTPADTIPVYPLRKKIERRLTEGDTRNVLLVGPEYQGKRDGLYRFCLSSLKNAPPLVVHFGSGGAGLCCFCDALSSGIRSFLNKFMEPREFEELEKLGNILFRERFQHEYPDYITQKGELFLQLLIEGYIKAALTVQDIPVFIFADLQNADAAAANLFISLYQSRFSKERLHIYGTWSTEPEGDFAGLNLWAPVFSRVLQFTWDDVPAPNLSELSPDLWEIAYAMAIFLLYFPVSLLVDIFEESGKKPATIRRAFSLLTYFGIIDSFGEPCLRLETIIKAAEEVLGERTEPIRLMVRNRLLAWVRAEKIRPCFNILKILVDLGWERSSELMLEAVQMDIIHGTCGEIEKSLKDGVFNRIAGQDNVPVLRYIYKTSRALVHGGEKEIREAFLDSGPETVLIPEYKTQILMNQANYFLSIRDTAAAMTMIKKSIMIIQEQREQPGLAQAYRLFALASLSNHRMSDAMDYASFAIENAKQGQDFGALALVYFCAAEIQYLTGNIFEAEDLILKAEDAAVSAGRPEWAEWARFFRGKLRFESGRYKDALILFESMQNNLCGYKQESAGQALSAWIYRSNIFLGEYAPENPPLPSREGLIFQLEAAYVTGDYEGAVKYSQNLLEVSEHQDFLFIEQPDWDSAYTQCELFIIPKSEIFFRLGSVFRALALCRLKPGDRENQEEALRLIRQVIQDEGLTAMDPNDAFYFYAYYLILKDSGAGEVDMNTIISIAFKRLQRRANQINDMETKHAFLSLHYWNNALYLAAREHKLI